MWTRIFKDQNFLMEEKTIVLSGGTIGKKFLCYAQKYRFILALFLLQRGLGVVLGKEPERYVLSKLRQPGG